MPKEDRRIIFSYDEVYKAIYTLAIQKDLKKPPAGMVKSLSERKDDETQITIVLENPADQTKNKLHYSRDFLAAALMVFCRGAGIPIPKSGRKSVMLIDGEVILRVQI